MTAYDVLLRIGTIDAILGRSSPEQFGARHPEDEALRDSRESLIEILKSVVIDTIPDPESGLSLSLRPDSWENLFDCLHAAETRISAQGNFWAAVQSLESQCSYYTPDRRKALGILEQEDI